MTGTTLRAPTFGLIKTKQDVVYAAVKAMEEAAAAITTIAWVDKEATRDERLFAIEMLNEAVELCLAYERIAVARMTEMHLLPIHPRDRLV